MATAIVMPKLGLSMEVGTVTSWHKRKGEGVRKGEPIVEIETDKIVSAVESPAEGILLEIAVAEGAEVKVRAVLGVIGNPGEDISRFLTEQAPEAELREVGPDAPSGSLAGSSVTSSTEGQSRPRLTPRARKLLADHGLPPEALVGIGKDRISEDDVRAFLERRARAGNQG